MALIDLEYWIIHPWHEDLSLSLSAEHGSWAQLNRLRRQKQRRQQVHTSSFMFLLFSINSYENDKNAFFNWMLTAQPFQRMKARDAIHLFRFHFCFYDYSVWYSLERGAVIMCCLFAHHTVKPKLFTHLIRSNIQFQIFVEFLCTQHTLSRGCLGKLLWIFGMIRVSTPSATRYWIESRGIVVAVKTSLFAALGGTHTRTHGGRIKSKI